MSTSKTHPIAAAVPVALVNVVAFAGQLAFLRGHLPWVLPGQVLVALALESIAIYLAFHAHVAQLANDSALRLRLAAYAFAVVIGAMNYDHYAGPGWRPTFPAVAFGLMSVSSPWLWAVHSRRVSRDALMAAGLVEPHALRLGVTRWAWHPLRSARVMFDATWAGVTDPREAVGRWDARHGGAPMTHPETVSQGAPETPAVAQPVSENETPAWDTPPAAADVSHDALGEPPVTQPPGRPERPTPRPSGTGKRDSQRDKARRLIQADPGISAGQLAEKIGVPRSTAGRWIKEDRRPRLVVEG